ncbi:hypothetical protein H6F78_16995 [Coleofasciculus sp. FACHB-64]|uniref:hypothetical protein n=1 Tax=Cyanophyceae TaxID=3028117 RepID=UPI00168879B5|nr:hypothetical protein [Coleofasciculus sp. FACHB-64]MBD2047268.1 hypothetical protein [Coleofasciculus sp. FACHB-64]
MKSLADLEWNRQKKNLLLSKSWFTPDSKASFQGSVYGAISSALTHTQLEGMDKALVNSDLKPLE